MPTSNTSGGEIMGYINNSLLAINDIPVIIPLYLVYTKK